VGTSRSTTTTYATTTTYETSKSTTTVFSTAASLTAFTSSANSNFNFACFEFLGNTYYGTNVSQGIPQVGSNVYSQNNTSFPLSSGHYAAQNAAGFSATHQFQIGAGGTVIGLNACGGGFSDRRLKKDIKLIGKSKNGLNIYEFRYIDPKWAGGNDEYDGKWQGVMADELEHIEEAVMEFHGYKYVNYHGKDEIDVELKRIK